MRARLFRIDGCDARPYKTGMLRRHVLFACLVLAVAAAAYSGYWFVTADRLRGGVERWAAARQAEGRDLRWTAIEAEGFPFAFRLRITDAAASGARPLPFATAIPVLIGEAAPWNLREWHLSAPQGAQLAMPVEGGTITASALDGTLALRGPEARAVTLHAHEISGSGHARLHIAEAELQLTRPDRAPSDHRDPALDLALHVAQLTFPYRLPPLGDTIDTLMLSGTVKGALPRGPLRDALAAWREDGGTIELQDGSLRWGALTLAANGTLALDETLQPIGALTATVEDQNAVIDAAVAQGTLRAGDASLAKIVLGLMAKPGPDGKPQLTVPLSLQNHHVFLGPAQIATLPRFTWE